MRKIEYYIKNVYGNPTIYIASKELSYTVQALTGKKTINMNDKAALTTLGCVFEQVFEPSN